MFIRSLQPHVCFAPEDGSGTAAPPPVATPAAPPPVVAAPAAAPAEPAPDPSWLKGRLDQAERAGERKAAEKAAAEKAALEAENKAAKERIAALEADAAKAKAYEATIKEIADAEFGALTTEQQDAVKEFAGDDPVKVRSTIAKLRPTWTVAPAAAPAPKPRVAPASTSAAPAAPPAAKPAAQRTHLEIYKQLERSNPVGAAQYLQNHLREISAEKQARPQT